MPIHDHVAEELIRALRARDRHRLRALRVVRSALVNAAHSQGLAALPDDACRPILTWLRDDALENVSTFAGGGRDELADAEVAEIAVYEELLALLGDPPRG